MPTYDYKCSSCGEIFEHFQSITQDPIKKCAICWKNTVKRLIGGGAGLIFKGSGFYITDYKNKGNGSGNSSENKPTKKEKPKKSIEKKD